MQVQKSVKSDWRAQKQTKMEMEQCSNPAISHKMTKIDTGSNFKMGVAAMLNWV